MNKQSKPEKLIDASDSSIYRFVFLDAYKKVLYAANRYAMAVIPVEVDANDVSGAIPVEAFAMARKLHKGHKEIQIDCNGVCKLIDGTTFARSELRPPHYGRVIDNLDFNALEGDSSHTKLNHIQFNTDYLSLVAEAIGSEKVKLVFTGQCSAMSVMPVHCPKAVDGAYGVLMPLRD